MSNIVNKYITQNPYFNDRKWIYANDLTGFMLHSVGCSQPDPLVFIRLWDKSSYTNAGINGFVGADVTYITAPCLESKDKVKRMPHGGKLASNDHYIGFEMCEPAQIRYIGGAKFTVTNLPAAQAFVRKTYSNAVELFAKLCTFHGKDPLKDGVIISHKEGWQRSIATDHGDPEHLWRGLNLPFTMDGFRKDVKKAMSGQTPSVSTVMYYVRKSWGDVASQIGAYKVLEYAKDNADKHPGYKVFDNKGNMIYDPAKEDEEMTQEKFNEMMNNYRKTLQDNDAGPWSQEARDWCIANGLINGTGQMANGQPNFAWADFLTREQAAALFYRFAKLLGKA